MRSPPSSTVHRLFSSNDSTKNAAPSYQVYGETAALTLRMIPPTFKQYGKSTVVVDGNKKGRLMLEFTPRKTGIESSTYSMIYYSLPISQCQTKNEVMISCDSHAFIVPSIPGRYAWDRSIKFAITAEETGMLLAKLHTLDGIDLYRQQAANSTHKVLRVQEFPDGSALFLVDYYLDGVGGQDSPSPKEGVSHHY
jgi:hypothetical protein